MVGITRISTNPVIKWFNENIINNFTFIQAPHGTLKNTTQHESEERNQGMNYYVNI